MSTCAGGRAVMSAARPFIVIQDMSGRIQLYVDKKNLPENSRRRSGDGTSAISSAARALHKSGKGDLYVYLDDATLLTKSLRPLPENGTAWPTRNNAIGSATWI